MFNNRDLFGGRQPPPPGQRTPVKPASSSSAYTQEPKRFEDGSRGPMAPGAGRVQLRPDKSPSEFIWRNLVAVSPQDIPLPRDSENAYLLLKGTHVVTARPLSGFPRGCIGLNEVQRQWMQITLTDVVDAEPYDPFRQGANSYLGSLDVEVGFATSKRPSDASFSQDELAASFTQTFRHQVFAPGQSLLLDFKAIKLKLTIRTVELVDLASLKGSGNVTQQTHPQARGILTPESTVNFFKDAKSPINLQGSTRRTANPIVRPDFKFEDMGIGGLDKEFSTIFRRAFVSRIMPPGFMESLGIDHLRGILLYGPPGTGKTLIARQIGKMLNAREPKVINGPEVLNKYVGQSEENIRNAFADAEKEQKEKGSESGLHIIIFDELDAVCKQRGSGAGGGTGVGDSIVNQLLTKLDGVNQLNNILLIGMTNRKDMIDEALLRAGRLEMHLEISLPDEAGRVQILNIHTANLRRRGRLADDVDIAEIARRTPNFSGAEINGLVKSAGSFALQAHVKGGTAVAVSDNINDMQVSMADFEYALDEVKPLFGVNEEALQDCVKGGIIPYGPGVNKILQRGQQVVEQVRDGTTQLLPVLMHGPKGSGKTALAAQIASGSDFPFVKLVGPGDLLNMNDSQKIQHLVKVFTDAYKSPQSLIVLDDLEMMVDWSPMAARFNMSILSTLRALLKKSPPKNRNLLILATAQQQMVVKQLEMSFRSSIAIPNLQTRDELAHVMQHSGQFDDREIRHALDRIESDTGATKIDVGIDGILECIQEAMKAGDKLDRFIEQMVEMIMQIQAF